MALKYSHTILVVDDEISITKSLKRLLRREGYEILTASSGREALDLMKTAKKRISLIISDQRMPEMNGADFLEKAKKIFPKSIRFLLTGYSDMEAITDAVNKGQIHRYLSKPWNDHDLLLQVQQALGQYELELENKRLMILTGRQNKKLNELNRDLEKKVEERSREIAKKNKELEANLFNTVRAFASLVEMNAPELAGHGRRVALQANTVAKKMDVSENEIIHVEIAALLHDIGKLGRSRGNNGDNGKKVPQEEAYRIHPEDGQEIVRFINHLDHVGLLIRCHHESYDGNGFPDGLSEEMIPLGSRIIAVVDAYDNIVNLQRDKDSFINEYLKEKGITLDHLPEEILLQQTAVFHLKKNTFIKYDPDVVKVFLELLKAEGQDRLTEREISLEDLKEGMVLSRSLYSSKGRFLLPYNTVLSRDYIDKLKILHKREPIKDGICVNES